MIARLPSRELKVANEAGGRLGSVRPAICAEGTQSEVGVLVHEPSVLSPQRQVARKSIIGATAIQKGASSLSTCTRHGSAKIVQLSELAGLVSISCNRQQLTVRMLGRTALRLDRITRTM
jgi:hypothetical protein